MIIKIYDRFGTHFSVENSMCFYGVDATGDVCFFRHRWQTGGFTAYLKEMGVEDLLETL